MSRTLIITFAFVCSIYTFAQNKYFDRLINKYDVIEYVKLLDQKKPDLFWEVVCRHNKTLNRLYEDIKNKKPLARDAQNDLYEAILFSLDYYNNLPISFENQFVADTLIKRICVKDIFSDAKMYVVEDNDINAFACPDGKIYITTAAIMCDSISVEGMIGICAHETVHVLLRHSLDRAYSYRKRENRNKIIAGVFSAVDVAANAYAQANGAVVDESWDNVKKRIEDNIIWAGENALRFRYKYSREQEIEADIIAYRFLEYMKWGGENYINALRTIGYENDKYYDDTSDHPTIEFRVKLLEYLASKR